MNLKLNLRYLQADIFGQMMENLNADISTMVSNLRLLPNSVSMVGLLSVINNKDEWIKF